jgi:hypothetical protein
MRVPSIPKTREIRAREAGTDMAGPRLGADAALLVKHLPRLPVKPIAYDPEPMDVLLSCALHRYVRRLASDRAGHRAIWLHFSRLKPSDGCDRHVEIACTALEELVQHFSGRLFPLRNGDIIVMCKDMSDKAVHDTVDVLRSLFEGDIREEGAEEFCSIFDLETAYARFVSALPPERRSLRSPVPFARPHAPPMSLLWRAFLILFVLSAVGLTLAYRSSQEVGISDQPEAQKAHAVRIPWTQNIPMAAERSAG